MKYQDVIYGEIEIDEEILIALMKTDAVTRLQGIMQHGISSLIGVSHPVTRFEHSVGVMYLTQYYGAPLKEQIAGLLHDVSHTAFSHVIDFVYSGHDNQSYHEEKKEQYMENSDLPDILESLGYDWRDFIEEDGYSILEQPSPALCADRLDYFLRDCFYMGLATTNTIKYILNNLDIHDGRIVAKNVEVARWLAYTYIEADKTSWASIREVGLYELTAQAIKRAMAVGYIEEVDLWGIDELLWKKLKACSNVEIQEIVQRISLSTRFILDSSNPTYNVGTKLRTIDPDIMMDGALVNLSDIDSHFSEYKDSYHATQDLWPITIIPI